MEPTFVNSVLFAVQMTAALVALMTVIFPIMTVAVAGWRSGLRSLPWAPVFGLMVGGFAIAPALAGSILAWAGWPY